MEILGESQKILGEIPQKKLRVKTSKEHQKKSQKTLMNKLLRRIALEKILKKLLKNFGRVFGRNLGRNIEILSRKPLEDTSRAVLQIPRQKTLRKFLEKVL